MTTDNAESQAKAQLESVISMIERLEHAQSECLVDQCNLDDDDILAGLDLFGGEITEEQREQYHNEEEAQQHIHEDPLSVQVRSGWYDIGALDTDTEPVEYEILLCTGGPAVRIRGSLGLHGEPVSARLQYQDWGTPWTEYILPYSNRLDRYAPLLTYAQQFYFGE